MRTCITPSVGVLLLAFGDTCAVLCLPGPFLVSCAAVWLQCTQEAKKLLIMLFETLTTPHAPSPIITLPFWHLPGSFPPNSPHHLQALVCQQLVQQGQVKVTRHSKYMARTDLKQAPCAYDNTVLAQPWMLPAPKCCCRSSTPQPCSKRLASSSHIIKPKNVES